ncbi:MAG TPA: hypothetical protein VFT72_02320 [Opitutaceae bacterium]|nr:hypothetical protein [Opitutaceae bacterium]
MNSISTALRLIRLCSVIFTTSLTSVVTLAAAKPRVPPLNVSSELPGGSGTGVAGAGGGSSVTVDVHGTPPPPPLFFTATAEHVVDLSSTAANGEIKLHVHVLQGKPERLTFGLSGEGEIASVSGSALRDWAVRQDIGGSEAKAPRLLDLRPITSASETVGAQDFDFTIRTKQLIEKIPAKLKILLLTSGDAAGFSSFISLRSSAETEFHIISEAGLIPVYNGEGASEPLSRFATTGSGTMELSLEARGVSAKDAALLNPRITGHVTRDGTSVEFKLLGQFSAKVPGARLQILSGRVALPREASGLGWHVEVSEDKSARTAFDLVAERPGGFPVEFSFVAAVSESSGWRRLDFNMPAGAIVPLRLDGLDASWDFKSAAGIVPAFAAPNWNGFLPASGAADLAWSKARNASESSLFFNSSERTEIGVVAGVVRGSTHWSARVLQGKLTRLRARLEGAGEIVGVEGANIEGWTVAAENGTRVLVVNFSRPVETEASVVVQTQSELGNFPAEIEPLKLNPEGAIRHSGFLRIAAEGGVRLEVPVANGLMQLSPEQLPGPPPTDAARHVFAFRFPSSDYRYRVLASLIQPEVAVSEIVTYEMGDSDRVIRASVELDVREAPLREWTMLVPDDFVVASVTGAGVADFATASASHDGFRPLKISFGEDVSGRQLIELRLEKNQAPSAGEWVLRPLKFPGAKSVRGSIGAYTTAGFRLNRAKIEGVVEVPLNYFPQQIAGLQQAWRVRDADWNAELQVDALAQSIQADVFHLYSVREGAVYCSALLNYFVVGAPATEWRFTVPDNAGNIDVIGMNVRRDWRREGNQIVVSLHQPAMGTATLLVTFEQPLGANGGDVALGGVQPIGVQAERGYIEVASALQVKHDVRIDQGTLLRLQASELPTEFRLLSTAPALDVFQYTGRPFSATLSLHWYAPSDTVEQAVDFARFQTRISADGEALTEVRYFVKSLGRKSLRFTLPTGLKLWEVKVGDATVNPRTEGTETIVPLPPKNDPNDAVIVTLRLGQAALGSGGQVALSAPRLTVPLVSNEWILEPDSGRRLIPVSSTAQPSPGSRSENGFDWIAKRALPLTALMLGFITLAGVFLKKESRIAGWTGVVLGLCALVAAGLLAVFTQVHRHRMSDMLSYTARLISPGQESTIEVRNVPAWMADFSVWGALAIAVGFSALVASVLLRNQSAQRAARTLALASVGFGLLAQPNGALYFYVAVGLGVLVLMVRAAYSVLGEVNPEKKAPPSIGPAFGGTSTPLMLLVGLGLMLLTPKVSHAAGAVLASDQTWSIHEHRLEGRVQMNFRAESIGDSFLLLKAAAVLVDFQAEGLEIAKIERAGVLGYYAIAQRTGALHADAKFAMPVDIDQGIAVPTGPAAAQTIAVEIDQAGWSFATNNAMQVTDASAGKSGKSAAVLVLQPQTVSTIRLQPRAPDTATEAKKIFVESSDLYLPAPGTVSGVSRIHVRPVQGHVSTLNLLVPEGWAVADVTHGPIRSWQFDAKNRRLRINFSPEQTQEFRFDVQTQLGAAQLPFELSVQPLVVEEATARVGSLAIAFGPDAQGEAMRTEKLSPVNVRDFDTSLLPQTSTGGQAVATVQNVWRFTGDGARLSMKIVGVAPEVRVAAKQVVTFDDERLLIADELNVAITRVGLFKLSFVLPEGLEIDALTGSALSQWTESSEGGKRWITLHLNGRTLGEQSLALTLSGAAPRGSSWSVPHLDLREATRQTTQVLVVPGKGIRLRLEEKADVTQIDARSMGSVQTGALAFRSLQETWRATIGVEQLEPWITLQALTEITLREGQELTRIGARYRVENAATKSVRVELPGLTDEQARTVHVSGSQVSEIVRESEHGDIWEIRFKRALAGETDVQIDFQGVADRGAPLRQVFAPKFPDARQVAQFVALRTAGRFELEAKELPSGWRRADWSAVPVVVQDRSDRSVPALCFRVAEPEHALTLTVRAQELSDALKLRVREAGLLTLVSTNGTELTALELQIDVLESTTLRARLPLEARLFNTYVNGEAVSAVRDGDAFLFNVSGASAATGPAKVRMVYAVSKKPGQRVSLLAPSLSVPLQNVNWRVIVPNGYSVTDYEGEMRLVQRNVGGWFGVDDYQSIAASLHSAEAQRGAALLREANALLERGDQQRAGEVLGRAALTPGLDEASNEDARVQLRNLKTQQTILGLNTRRQRLYLDNRSDAARNESLEQAATLNPFMQGQMNFDPRSVDQLLQGNTQDENAALRGIARRIVDQQLAPAAAPGAIDLTFPTTGEVLDFNRSLQVDASAPLTLRLELSKANGANGWVYVVLLAGVVLAAYASSRFAAPARG